MTRLAAFILDGWILTAGFTLGLAGIDYLGTILFSSGIEPGGPGLVWVVAFSVVAFLYFFLGTEVSGRTPGMALVGLRVVRWDGDSVGAGAAFVRTVAAVPGALLLGIGPLVGVFQRNRRALHDVVSGTAVVHDWSPRPVELSRDLSRSLGAPSLP